MVISMIDTVICGLFELVKLDLLLFQDHWFILGLVLGWLFAQFWRMKDMGLTR